MNLSASYRALIVCACILGAGAQFPAHADDVKAPAEETFSIVPHGFAGIQSFRINRFKNGGLDYKSEIYNNSVLNFTFDLLSGEHLAIRAGMEGYVNFSTVPYDKLGTVGSGATEVAGPLWSWYMAQGEMAYSLGEKDDAFHGDIGVGLFPYKYNEDARNLGEYMFRSGTYPGWLLTTFDWTSTRLTGLRFSSDLFNKWHNDIMLTTEMEWFPFYDLSLSWISNLPVGNALNVGWGVDFARFLPANDDLTTPPITQLGDKRITNYYTSGCDATLANCDTSFYTFTGIKLMGRFDFDPKRFFISETSDDLFSLGKEDGKIFGEVAVLGLKNQGPLYHDVKQRMPVMVGVNIPTFNLLDVLAFQMEYYAMPYPNDYSNQIQFVAAGVPQPTKGYQYGNPDVRYTTANANTGQANFYAKHHVYWSLYSRRWLGKHLAIVAQAARDHWRTSTPYSNKRDFEEALSDPSKQWYAALKIVSVW